MSSNATIHHIENFEDKEIFVNEI